MSAAACAAITRQHARTFYLASLLLPREKRRAAYAIYAFCRRADDAVDVSRGDVASKAAALATAAGDVSSAAGGRATDPIYRELQWAIQEFGLPEAPFHELLAGVARDVEPMEVPDFPTLERYCQGVASSVGELCVHVFRLERACDLPAAVRHARTLGVAMQLTNVLRDIGEDAVRGRCYLPSDELATYGLTPAAVLDRSVRRHLRWREFLDFQIERARRYYRGAVPGIGLLAADAHACARACAVGYGGILELLSRPDADPFSRRARLGAAARLGVLAQAWFGRDRPLASHGENPSFASDETRGSPPMALHQ